MAARRTIAVTPSAARLTGSLRDIGYDFPSAIADLVDNSIAAHASVVDICIEFAGPDSYVTIADDGDGMSANGVTESLRFGSRRPYERGDLGRYGLGLKTASLSQCRSVTVATHLRDSNRTSIRQLNLDVIAEWDEWLVIDPGPTTAAKSARQQLEQGFNTVVTWEDLDRVLPEQRQDGGWAKRRLDSMVEKTRQHLAMVFHQFLDEVADDCHRLVVTINGEKVKPWDPFASEEPKTKALPSQRFEITVGELTGSVRLDRFVLPHRQGFSSAEEFERLSGPMKWNRQQGLYIYRAGRLVQWGGWAGTRAIDEHTKLARAALHFDTDLDSIFNINVAKMRVGVPPQLKQMLERPINELCLLADDVYRRNSRSRKASADGDNYRGDIGELARAGLALRTAALQSGDYEALIRMAAIIRDQAPDAAKALGLSDL